MRRHLAAAGLWAALAASAAAQTGPMAPISTNDQGDGLWADRASLLVQGTLRTLWVAVKPAGKEIEDGAWMRVDCVTPRYQFIDRVEGEGLARTTVGESQWYALDPNQNADGMGVRNAICAM